MCAAKGERVAKLTESVVEVRSVLAKSIGGGDGGKSPEELEAAVRQIV